MTSVPKSTPALGLLSVALGLVALLRVRREQMKVDRRRRRLWIAWGAAITVEVTIVIVAMHLMVGWPDHPEVIVVGSLAAVPLAAIVGTTTRGGQMGVDRPLIRTIELVGLTALVLGVYLLVVLGLNRRPEGDERGVLVASMLAAGLAALAYPSMRTGLTERMNRWVYGSRTAPEEALRNFGQRMTRAIPLDELMQQLTESLRSSMGLASAEVWTGQEGHYELMAGVPHRSPPPVEIGATERAVVARAGVGGGTWIDIWVPQLAGDSGSSATRVAPVAHGGLLLGFIAVTRRADDEPFTELEETTLAETARQIGLALHNVQLDAALQASLDEVKVRNQELQQSRARIVAAGDAERRKLERNLHDGAQQHLVALAVKLRLAADAVEGDPQDALAMIDEIRCDVQSAIAELRALAHGIYPPLLASGGLIEALPAAAARAGLPTTVDADGIGRYGDDVEAAVYFCTVEALQNAGKHAGSGATASIAVREVGETLHFEIRDDGAGFDVAAHTGPATSFGHGFVNMADRLGAIGGRLTVDSAPGAGTTIVGEIPIET